MKAEKKCAEKERKDSLQNVAQQNERTCTLAVHAHRIGKPCVSASPLADILLIKDTRDENGTVDASKKI